VASSPNAKFRRTPVRWLAVGLFGPFIATIVPIAAALLAIILIGRVEEVYEGRELPSLTAWVFHHRWAVALMLVPAALCGMAVAFVQRRYLLYGPYLALLMAPLLLLVASFAWVIISIYAEIIENAM
jgi:hypothetical protein